MASNDHRTGRDLIKAKLYRSQVHATARMDFPVSTPTINKAIQMFTQPEALIRFTITLPVSIAIKKTLLKNAADNLLH